MQVSYDLNEYTANVDALGTLRILDAILAVGLGSRVRFCQASTGEMYGRVQDVPQNEKTTFSPSSPYGKILYIRCCLVPSCLRVLQVFAISWFIYKNCPTAEGILDISSPAAQRLPGTPPRRQWRR